MEGVDPARLRHAPLLGAHTREVMLEHGYSPDDVAALLDTGVVSEPATTSNS